MATITLKEATGRHTATLLTAPASFILDRGEQIAIMGANGSGKSTLVGLLTGRIPLQAGSLTYDFGPDTPPIAYGNLSQVTFEDVLGTVEKPYYFQQRFNSQDCEESPLVATVLKRVLASGKVDASGLSADEARAAGHGLTSAEAQAAGAEDDSEFLASPLLDTFLMRPLLQKRMVLLSSGEMRRFQLFKHLTRHPRVLIVDNPFIGLDAPMRDQLDGFFRHLIEQSGVQIIMVLSMLDRVPDYLTHVVQVTDGKVGEKQTRAEYLAALPNFKNATASRLSDDLRREILQLPNHPAPDLSPSHQDAHGEIITVRGLSLRLPASDRVLYGGLDWQVKNGEHWALQGSNGAGKSTLLSLITADHPQAYACDISLFGRQRGSGESIWDIKHHIGFVSPEFHRAYKENRPAIDIVASGLFDSVGLYRHPTPEQAERCSLWLRVFGIDHLRNRLFLTLSSGEQRLCLLARAFVKDPALLILDEPLHGLDTYRRHLVRDIIATFASRPNKTLIMVSHYQEELPDIINRHLRLT